ncbi:MAG TPA: NAD(P)H-hydrate dehydratase [Planctomycetota bacterium]|nr:NAD(P)H-hydrate dehydratase [Planctomycetota bacterium]
MRRVTRLPRLPRRDRDSHKGTFGHALVLGGSPGLTGAPALAALGALRSGAGLATVGCPRGVQAIVAGYSPCLMTLGLPESASGTVSHAALAPALRFSSRCRAAVIGPGLGRDRGTGQFVRSFLSSVESAAVVDADGLNLLAGHAELLHDAPGSFVLTPHPGEAGRLLGLPASAPIPEDRRRAALDLAAATGGVVVLKGHRTLVTDGERLFENRTGNPGMATGGTGDVLAGVIAALLAQRLDPFDAAVLGVAVHGRAGDLAAGRRGEVSLVASDLLEALPDAFRRQ